MQKCRNVHFSASLFSRSSPREFDFKSPFRSGGNEKIHSPPSFNVKAIIFSKGYVPSQRLKDLEKESKEFISRSLLKISHLHPSKIPKLQMNIAAALFALFMSVKSS